MGLKELEHIPGMFGDLNSTPNLINTELLIQAEYYREWSFF